MTTKEESNEKRCFMIPFTSKAGALLLVEVAQSRGLDGWIEAGNRWEVVICGDEDEVKLAVDTAHDSDELLHLKQLEALALTIQGIGETPSKALMESIAAARRRLGSGKNNNRLAGGLGSDSSAGRN